MGLYRQPLVNSYTLYTLCFSASFTKRCKNRRYLFASVVFRNFSCLIMSKYNVDWEYRVTYVYLIYIEVMVFRTNTNEFNRIVNFLYYILS